MKAVSARCLFGDRSDAGEKACWGSCDDNGGRKGNGGGGGELHDVC